MTRRLSSRSLSASSSAGDALDERQIAGERRVKITLGVEVDRMLAAQVGLNEGDIGKSLQESLSGSFKVAPTFWINPQNGVDYPIVAQTPQYWLDSVSSLENIPASREDASQIIGGLATIKRETSPAVVSHYAV